MGIGGAALFLALGCSRGGPATDESTPVPAHLSAELVSSTWQVRMADDATRAPFEGHAGWTAFFERDLARALVSFGDDQRALARVHMLHAGLYRQAALLAARATLEVYGADRQDTDPAGVDHLLAAAALVTGDCAGAAASLKALGRGGPNAAARAAMLATVSGGCTDWPDAPAFPGGTPEGEMGTDPEPDAAPHYQLALVGGRALAATDPLTLQIRSNWHLAQAHAAAPEGEGAVIDGFMQLWDGEPVDAGTLAQELPDAYLFAGFILAASDLPFLADAAAHGAAAVATWAERSPLASSLQSAVVSGAVDPERVIDLAADVGKQIQAAMSTAGGGQDGFHRPFAQMGRLGVLRAGMVVADGNGQSRDAGILRLNALDLANGPLADPVFALSVAAWDAGNRNPLRAQELMHSLARDYPALEGARYPLDAMHIRLSRNAGPSVPVQ